jgi:hypothetical protein
VVSVNATNHGEEIMATTNTNTNHTPGIFCACRRCAAEIEFSLAESRRTSAVQAAKWHPRSKRARARLAEAERVFAAACTALDAAK